MHLQPTVLETVRQAWSWTGIDPLEIVASNAFGNVIVRSNDDSFWRICPEDLSCKVIAKTPDDLCSLRSDAAFTRDWEMTRLVDLARNKLGPVNDERCYCLKLPAVVGGKYDVSNFGTNSRIELLTFTGDLAYQIRNLPDGAKVRLVVTE